MRKRNVVLSLLLLSMLFSFTANSATAKQTISPNLVIAQDQSAPPSDEVSKKYGFNLVQEMILGRTVAYGLLNRFGNKVYDNEKATKYVNLVGQSIAKVVSKRPQIKYRFGILDTYEINAFACPGGYIFITKGMLKAAKNENELAAVLAHEIGHVEAGDGLKDINEHKQDEYAKIKMENLEADIATINDVATSLPYAGWYASYYSPSNMAKRGIGHALGHIPGYGGYVASATVGVASDAAVDAASKGLKGLAKKFGEVAIKRWYYTPLSPDVEYKADAFSIAAVAQTGYDPKGLKTFLETMRNLEKPPNQAVSVKKNDKVAGAAGAEGDSIFSYTHPTSDSRIMKIDELISKPTFVVKNPSATDNPVFKERFKQSIRSSN